MSSPCLQKANKGQSRAIERLKKKMFENEFWLLLNSPAIPFRIHNRNGKVSRAAGERTGLYWPRRDKSALQHCLLSSRATCSCCPLTTRGLNGGRPFRNCRKKVILVLLRPPWVVFSPECWDGLVPWDCSHCHPVPGAHPSEAPLLSSCRPPGLCAELGGAAGADRVLLQATHCAQHPGHQQ